MRKRLLPFQGSRLLFFSVIMLCTFIVLIMRLYEFQFTDYKEFSAAAAENSIQHVSLPAPRGVIYDRYGVKLALNAAAFNVSIIPAALPADQTAALKVLHRLSALINVPDTRAAADAAGKTTIRSLDEQVKEGEGIAPYRPVVVATDVPQEIAQNILEDKQNLPGVQISTVSVRQYGQGNDGSASITAQVIGYLGPIDQTEANQLRDQGLDPTFERTGYAGVEKYLNVDLAGKRGQRTQEVDVAGLPIHVVAETPATAGRNVRLTLDLQLQIATEQALQDQINTVNAFNAQHGTSSSDSGVVIALNPKTGEILAMVSLPTYDNSRFARSIDAQYYSQIALQERTPLLNHAISSLYPPGSTWKLLTANAVLQENVIKPETQLTDPGFLDVQNRLAKNDVVSSQRFVCWLRPPARAGHGQVDLIHAIAWSCDVYFYQVGGGNPAVDPKALKPGGLGIIQLDRYATAFGIGVDLGVELPAEVGGRMPDPTWKRRNYGESWSTGDTYNAAFGQGYVTVTPLQLISAAATIANGGTMYQPTIIKDWVDSEGNAIPGQTFQPHIMRTLALPTGNAPVYLNMREDMYVMGDHSLVCVCEPDSPYYVEGKCTPEFQKNYTGTLSIDQNSGANQSVSVKGTLQYKVNIPFDYIFGGMCDPQRIQENKGYVPAFVNADYIKLVQTGMRLAVTDRSSQDTALAGTALKADLGLFHVAGKTGTAEYCDEIARPQGLCQQGNWPAHAWFIGYGPYENPEIAVVAFIYHGDEGSANALPVVKKVLDCYRKLTELRNATSTQGQPVTAAACDDILHPKPTS